MEERSARLTILIDADRKKAFEALCAARDITVSQAMRQLIRQYLAEHGVDLAGRAEAAPPRKVRG